MSQYFSKEVDNDIVDRVAWAMGVSDVLALQKFYSSGTMTYEEMEVFRKALLEDIHSDIYSIGRDERFAYLKGYFMMIQKMYIVYDKENCYKHFKNFSELFTEMEIKMRFIFNLIDR